MTDPSPPRGPPFPPHPLSPPYTPPHPPRLRILQGFVRGEGVAGGEIKIAGRVFTRGAASAEPPPRSALRAHAKKNHQEIPKGARPRTGPRRRGSAAPTGAGDQARTRRGLPAALRASPPAWGLQEPAGAPARAAAALGDERAPAMRPRGLSARLSRSSRPRPPRPGVTMGRNMPWKGSRSPVGGRSPPPPCPRLGGGAKGPQNGSCAFCAGGAASAVGEVGAVAPLGGPDRAARRLCTRAYVAA